MSQQNQTGSDPAVGKDRPILRGNMLAILMTIVSMATFLLNDTMVKLSADAMPMSQIVVVRGLFATGLLLAAVIWLGDTVGLRHIANARVIGRGAMETLGTFFFLTALFNMSIANVTAIFQCVPFLMTILAVIFLGEKVGIRRWAAIAVGFLGVLFIVRPDIDGFNIYALSVLVAALAIAVRDILTRTIDNNIPTSIISFVTSLLVLLAAAIASPFETWVPMTWGDVLWLAMASVCIVLGYSSIVLALRVGNISVVAPYRYTIIIFSLLSGYLVWGDVPTLSAFFGIVLITGSGIFVFVRERKHDQEEADEGLHTNDTGCAQTQNK